MAPVQSENYLKPPFLSYRPWVLPSGLFVLLSLLVLFHTARADYWGADDVGWFRIAEKGLLGIYTEPSVLNHFRPVFATWLFVLLRLGADTPFAFSCAAICLSAATFYVSYRLFRYFLTAGTAIVASSVLLIHPVRQAHLFWVSGQIDAICLLLSLLTLRLATENPMMGIAPQGRRLLILLLSAVAVLTKETALILPIMILGITTSIKCRERTRLATYSLLGAVVSVVVSYFVLGSGGRGLALVQSVKISNLFYYPLFLFYPIDPSLVVANALISGQMMPLVIYCATTAVILVCFLYVTWRFRSQPWLRGSLLLLAAGGLICLVRADPRGLGLGCAGLSLCLGGVLSKLGQQRLWRITAVVIIPLAVIWGSCWLVAERNWREAKRIGKVQSQAITRLRSMLDPSDSIVVIGLSSHVGKLAHVQRSWEIDAKVASLFAIYTRTNFRPGKLSYVSDNVYRISVRPGDVFNFTCKKDAFRAVRSITCAADRYPLSVTFDTSTIAKEWCRPTQCQRVSIYRFNGLNLEAI